MDQRPDPGGRNGTSCRSNSSSLSDEWRLTIDANSLAWGRAISSGQLTLPFLLVGSTRRVLFPSKGKDVPFTIANYAYVDSLGRETVTWSRRFRMKRKIRAFDATMINSRARRMMIDYLGTHQHLAVDIHCSVDDAGAMCIESGEQRFYEGRIAFRFPLLFSGVAKVREWWDEHDQRFKIDVRVENRVFGPLFGYHGSFTVKEHPCLTEDVPLDVKPIREETRE